MRNESVGRSRTVPGGRHRVAVVAAPGVPLFELAIAIEVFGTDRSDLTPEWYDFTLVASDPDDPVIAHGVVVPTTSGLAQLALADTIVVPACRDVHDHAAVALLDALRSAHDRGARLAAICSGSFVLAEAGLLDGRRATTHWMHAAELARRYPAVRVDPDVLYVDDGVWTSAGSAAGLDMCLEIVRRDHGAAVANELARRIVTPPHRHGGQAQYVRPATVRAAPRPDLQYWARGHLDDVTVTALAREGGISPRTLHRHFRDTTGLSPQQWIQRLRLDTAAELLEATDLTLDVIARRVGLGTPANLRARFTRTYGVAPSRYRETFRSSHDSGRGAPAGPRADRPRRLLL